MADLTPEEITRAKEDLTIQQVILESLDDAEFSGAEEDRQEARDEIERLQGILKEAALASVARKQKQATDHSQPSFTSQPDGHPGTSANSSASSHTLETMDPNPNQSNSDIWTGSSSLPGRKRDFDADATGFIDVRQKSRRTTPSQSSSPFRPTPSNVASGKEIVYIDLTGDDIEADSNYIAEQIKQERVQKQENEDHKYAMQLSQRPLARTPPHSGFESGNTSNNALSKLMATQRVNGPPSSNQDGQGSEYLKVEYPGFDNAQQSQQTPHARRLFFKPLHSAELWQDYRQPKHQQPSQMPGSYDPNWDLPTRNPHAFIGPNGVMTPQSGHPRVPVVPSQSMNHLNHAQHNAASIPRHGYGTDQSSQQIRHSMAPHQQPQLPASSALRMSAAPVYNPSSHLGNIINSTSKFLNGGFSHGMDYSAMPERLANFLEGAIHDPRVTEKELDELLQNIRPDMEIPNEERGKTVDGLKSSLYHHQELALAWMQKMEEGSNKGGILADDMGLGKTVTTLGLILSRPATSRPKTNLIIGPLSLIRQWEDEIKNKTTTAHRLSVFIYHNKKTSIDDLLTYDVVLTTYGTIAKELKRLETFYKENAGRNFDFNDRTTAIKFPLLHPRKATFYRVILDEAQCIKNRETQTAKACHALKASYRWCLTGTPMMNGVIELYSLLCFLKIKPYCVWDRFRQSFGILFGRNGDEKAVAMTRLRALLKAVMLRRKKDSKLDGKPILRLPEKHEETVYAELSTDERDYYKQLEERSQVQFSKYLRDGSIGKNYSNILVLLLRLRQACCHPHLNMDVDDATPVNEADVIEIVKKLEPSIIARIKEMDAFECPICYDAVPSPCFFVPCGHDSCQQCLSRLTDTAQAANIQEGTESDKARCPVCRSPFDPRKCFSYETFKSVHMPETMKPDPEDEEEDIETTDDESETGEDANGDDLKDFVVDDHFFSDSEKDDKPEAGDPDKKDGIAKKEAVVKKEETEEDAVAKEYRAMKRRRRRMEKGKQKAKKEPKPTTSTVDVKPSMLKALRVEAKKNREAYRKYMAYLRQTWMPAAKVTECIRLLKEAEDQNEENKGKAPEKTIVFSQWTLLLDLIEVAMEHDGHKNKARRYDGGMSGEERNLAAKAFQDPNRKEVTVLLVSLRAGNAGLNLTQATRVIIMDPFWNPYIEMQAVDRAHRIGQQRQLKVYRILTKDTVEDRIVELKERKQAIVESALDEAESAKIGRLGVGELKFLFNSRD